MINISRSYRLPLVILFFELVGVWILFKSAYAKNSPVLNYYMRIPFVGEVIDNKKDKINAVVADYTNKIPGDYSVYIKDLRNSKTYTLNEEKVFNSASIYKLAILYKVYEDIQNNKLKKDDVLSADMKTLDQQLSGTGSDDQVDDGGDKADNMVSYSVDYATKLMIRISDNYASLLLANKVGWGNAQKSLEDVGIWGFDLTSGNAPRVTALTVGQLLEKIEKRQAVSQEASAEMLRILQDQRIDDRIPKLLPEDIIIAHKTGELDNVRHDAGIVFGRRGNYIFVFLSDTNEPLVTSENMAQASRQIFDILEK